MWEELKRKKSVLRERPLSVRLAKLHKAYGSLTTSNKKGRGKPAIREGSILRRTVEISNEKEDGADGGIGNCCGGGC
ncbi:hypothetical protein BY996DRAFT_6588480 [Phakopsora pachyrhizi]|uniref:Uncharacterized protein n=1 Tax=Phakopsora pachyrhizi TaxID=170000 RepID=A0AAV0AJ89_PHAPC|nr:hypothetical protein BY996DRAFT_6588480 [Phakopsora pachyrhizi]CAH7667829.1 hypothetical protein PPACK8108_LOCUS2259 [Phakopsora pachyrhizi]